MAKPAGHLLPAHKVRRIAYPGEMAVDTQVKDYASGKEITVPKGTPVNLTSIQPVMNKTTNNLARGTMYAGIYVQGFYSPTAEQFAGVVKATDVLATYLPLTATITIDEPTPLQEVYEKYPEELCRAFRVPTPAEYERYGEAAFKKYE